MNRCLAASNRLSAGLRLTGRRTAAFRAFQVVSAPWRLRSPSAVSFFSSSSSSSSSASSSASSSSSSSSKSPADVLRECDAVLSANPKSVEALVLKCDSLYRLGRWEEALSAATQALSVDPVNVRAHVLKADVLHRQGKEDLALEAAAEACEKVPTSAEAFRLRGVLLATKGDLSEALVHLNTAARLGPKAAETHYERGRVLAQLNDHAAAIAAFSKALGLDPTHTNSLNMKAVSQAALKEFDAALETWNQAILVDPHNSGLLANKGKLLLRLKQYDKAAEALQAAVQAELDHGGAPEVSLRLALAESLISASRWTDGAASLRELIAADTTNPVAHALLGQCLFRTGKLTEALQALDRALELTSTPQPSWVHARASVLHRLNKDEQAVQELEKVIAEHPNTNVIANLYLLLGQVYLRGLRNAEKARECLDQAIEKDPELFDAYTAKAVMLDESGDHEGALKLWDKALELNGECCTTVTNRGRCLFHLSRNADALAAFDRAIALRPSEPEPYKAKGVLLWTSQDQAGAQAAWAQGAAAADPDVYLHYLLSLALRARGDAKEALRVVNRARDIGQEQGAVPLEVMELRDAIMTEIEHSSP